MITNEEARKAIEKYQKEHPLHFGTMIDVTAISSKEGAEIISQTVEKVSKKIEEDTDLWCICEMAKLYMQGVRPVYPVRPQGKWIETNSYDENIICSSCKTEFNGDIKLICGGENPNYCPECGADMRSEPCSHDCDNCEHGVPIDGQFYDDGTPIHECGYKSGGDT